MASDEVFERAFARTKPSSGPWVSDAERPPSPLPPREPQPDLPKHMATTRWHFIVMFAVPASILLQTSVPLSFEAILHSLVGNSSSFNYFDLPWLYVITSGCPCLLAPILVPLNKRKRLYYRYASLASFVLMGLSCFIASSSDNPDLLYLSFAMIYTLSSSLLLAVQIVIMSDYFPVGHPHHILGTSICNLGPTLSSMTIVPFLNNMTESLNWKDALQLIGGFIAVTGFGVALLLKPIGTSSVANFSQKRRGSGSSSDTDAISDKESDFSGEEGCGKYIAICSVFDLTHKPQLYLWMASSYLYYLKFAALVPHLGRLITMKSKNSPVLHENSKYVLVSTFMIMSAGSAITVVLMSSVGRLIKGRLVVVSLIGTLSLVLVCLLLAFTPPTYETIFLLFCLFGISREMNGVFRYPCSQEVLRMDLANGQALSYFFGGLGVFTSPVFSILMVQEFNQMGLLWTILAISMIEGVIYIGSMIAIKRFTKREEYDDL